MDFTSKNMYDTFKDEIWKELGPLDPNWFEVLTAQASADEGNVSDQEDLCANQEGNFKPTLDKTEVDSQLFSTPKVFRLGRIVSPQTEDEQSFTTEQEKGILPWTTTQSPHTFTFSKQGVTGVKYGGVHPRSEISFDLLRTPHKSPNSYAKHISESLGAQINPDISWTSSLNTPPAVPSTLILSKKDTSPCPASISAEQNVVFVRKLFPSLSNPSKARVIPSQNSEAPPVHQGAVFPEADSVDSVNQSDGVWRQKLPDAIADGEIRSTVTSVLDGAENVLSIFFANSSSALRKVRPERIRPKPIFPTKEHSPRPVDEPSTDNPASSKDGPADQKSRSVSQAAPAAAADQLSQWSPLSLSEINTSAQQSQSDSDAAYTAKPPATVPASGLTKKKRTFVYTIAASKPEVQSKESQSQMMNSSAGMPDSRQHSSVKQLGEAAPGELSCSRSEKTAVQQQGSVTQESPPPSVQAKDLDMSQLCKEFAQDFSQTSGSDKMSKVTEDPRSHFSPSACLLAVKLAKQKTIHEDLQPNFNEASNRKPVSLTNETYSINEGVPIDSGFQSAVIDTTHMSTSSVVPSCSGNTGQLSCKGDIHRTSAFPSAKTEDEKVNIDVAAVTRLCSGLRTQLEEGQTEEAQRKSDMEGLPTSKQLPNSASATIPNSHCIPTSEQLRSSLPEKTGIPQPSCHTSGFRTASNKGIHISSANLERAKILLQEAESGKTFNSQPTESDSAIRQQMCRSSKSEFIISNSNQLPSLEGLGEADCQLTESQKADVTELCTLLEEAESQFEFTQFRTGEMKQNSQGLVTSLPKTEKELDADLLTGIDFDDSFPSDADRHLASAGTPDKITSVASKTKCGTSEPLREPESVSDSLNKVRPCDQGGPSSSLHMSGGNTCDISTKPQNIHRVENTETNKLENRNPPTLGVSFRSAGLSKARALFADLEKPTDLKSADNQVDAAQNRNMDSFGGKEDVKDEPAADESVQSGLSSMTEKQTGGLRDKDDTESFNNFKMLTATGQSGFHMASGKTISVSAKYIQQAHALFKDCDITEINSKISVKEGKTRIPVSENTSRKNWMTKADISDEQTSEMSDFGNAKAPRKRPHPENGELKSTGANGTLTSLKSASHHENPFSTSKPVSPSPCTSSEDIDSSAIDGLSKVDGFCTASGKKVSVSTDSLKRAEHLLDEHYTPEDSCKKNSIRRTGQLSSAVHVTEHKTSGFQTSAAISSAALRKAKALMRECHEVEDNFSEKPSQSQMPIRNAPPGRGGFISASGKPVALSSEALLKAEALFSDISLSVDNKQDCSENTRNIYPDLKSPVEENVQGRQYSLLKAEVGDSVSAREADGFVQDCMDSNKRMPIKPRENETIVKHKPSSDLKAHQNMTVNVSEEPGNGLVGEHAKHKDTLRPQNGGFQTASGKTLKVSSEALRKAKALLNECEEVEPETSASPAQFKVPLPGPSSRHSGFQAASGRQVSVSSEALQRAKALFSDISLSADIQTDSGGRISDKKEDVGDNTEMHHGFTTAGGEKVHVSQKNLVKAKHCLKELTECVSTAIMHRAGSLINQSDVDGKNGSTDEKNLSKPKSDERGIVNISEVGESACSAQGINIHEKQITKTFPPLSGGFQTASGKGVAVSSEALRKAKALLSEYEGVEDESMGLLPRFKAPAAGQLPRNNGFLAASGKHVAVSSEALQRAKALFSDISLSADIQAVSGPKTSDNKQDKHEDTEEMCRGFTTARGEKVHVSQKSLLKAKHLLNEFDDSVSTKVTQEAVCLTTDYGMDGNYSRNIRQMENGPSIKSAGEKESFSDLKQDQQRKIKLSKEPGNGWIEDTNKQLKQKSNTLPKQNDGFQTACGKEVTVSSEALRKAKTLLSKCEEVEDKIGASPPHFKVPLPGPSSRNCGFQAASGKQVSISSEALQRAKALFSDISSSADVQTDSAGRTYDDKQDKGGNPQVFTAFTKAAGAKVQMSHKNLLKSKHLLEELKSEMSDLQDSVILDLPVEKTLNHVTSGETNMSALGGKTLTCNNDAPKCSSGHFMENKVTEDTVEFQGNVTSAKTVNLQLSSEQEEPNVLNCDVNKSSCSKETEVTGAKESSLLSFQSLHLAGCTETQQDFVAQEAIDCTKALLEDECLAGQSFSPTSQFMPFPESPYSSDISSKRDKGKGKRSFLHDDVAGQPPLKRRLLEQFDKTVDGSRSSTLQPVKSCPSGVLKDRGVFQYSVSLRPNVTRPHRSGKNYVEHKLQGTDQTSASGGDTSACFKTPAFVPPFIKNARANSCGNMVAKDKTRAAAFVPPFKKQRSEQQENGSKLQQEDKDEELHPSVKPSDSSSYVPPSKKTHVDVVADATSDAMMNNQVLPVEGGSACSDPQSSCVDSTLSASKDLHQNLQNTALARDMQDMRIRKKKRQTIRPLPGSLFLTKTSGVAKIPLKTAVNGKAPAKYPPKELYGYGVHWHVGEITSETAECFRFNLLQFMKREALVEAGGVQLGDGGWLIPSSDGTAGKQEFYRALCDTPGVDPKLLSEAWVFNHYRWIVWKQASMEKSFPETMGSRCLTPEQVLLQLKYRYDVEVDHSRRPALRKILEKDDTAAKTLVLCVSGMASMGRSPNKNADADVQTPPAVVWLSDGWYAIKAQLDEPLTAMLHKGRLAVGGKLIIHGAQLLGSQEACPPLEAPESAVLKICANSCRPVRWDVKLGFYKDPRPFLLPVSSLYSNGGPVGRVDVVILRTYPVQWMERKPDGAVVFRSVRAEEKEARRYSAHKQKAMETLFAKIQAQFEQEEKGIIKPQRRQQPRNYQDITALQEGEELYEAVGDDPACFEAHLSEHQLEALRNYRHSLMEKKQRELQDRYQRALEAEDSETKCPKRDVTPVWRLSVADSLDQLSKVYQLNLWRPSSDLQSLLKEGCCYKVYNLVTSEGKKRSGIESVQLTGTKKTQFQDLQVSSEWLSTRFQPRATTSFVNLQDSDFQPLCGEVDVTGYVISVIDEHGSSPAFYLVDGDLNFVKVRCFSSFSQSGLEDVVKPHVLLALSNLQLRGQSMCPTPVVYAGDLTGFSTNPKEVHLQESLSKIKAQVQCHSSFFQTAEEKLSSLINCGTLSSFPAALQPQTPAPADATSRVASHKPVRSLGSFTPVNRNPPAASASSEKDPRSLKRKRALDYLSHIPSPPPLCHLSSVASPCVKKTFNPPRRSGTPSTLKTVRTAAPRATEALREREWVNDEELAMIDTQALHVE